MTPQWFFAWWLGAFSTAPAALLRLSRGLPTYRRPANNPMVTQ
ncbi:MAG TPA: hypothetical protein PK620_09160 [Denitromonas sp.]|nr:hypothetical protein [Denitromonas sp.]HQV15072.1 hypothetical protein [Denitromonas sp.]